MSTSTIPVSAPAQTTSPVMPVDYAAAFYGSEAAIVADPPAEPDTSPAQTPDPGSSTQPETAASTPPVDAKQEEPPKGTEDEKDPVKKQLSEQTSANRRLGRELGELRQNLELLTEQNKVLQQKLDGTYQEPTQPTSEQIAAQAEFKGREHASRVVADGLFGKDEVQAKVYDKGSPYETLVKDKPWLHVEVYRHAQPAVAAMRVLQREAFTEKYGDDPAKWAEKIEAELRPKIVNELKKQAITPLTGTAAPSVTEARSSGAKPRERSLEDMFYGGAR